MAEQTRRDLAITIKARVNGFDCDLSFDGAIDQLQALTRRLAELGAERTSAPVPAQPQQQRRPRVQPRYDGDGDPCCPVHNRKLSEGQYGPYCSAKAKGDEVVDKRGYCGLKFAE